LITSGSRIHLSFILLFTLGVSSNAARSATDDSYTAPDCTAGTLSNQQALVQAHEAWLDFRLSDARQIIACHQLIEADRSRADALVIDALSAQYQGDLEQAGQSLASLSSESATRVSNLGLHDALTALSGLDLDEPAGLARQLTDTIFEIDEDHSVLATHAYGTWLATEERFEEAYSVFRAGLKRLSIDGRDTPAMLPLLEGMADVYLLENRVGRKAVTVLKRMADLTLQRGEDFTAEQKALAHIKLGNHYLRFSMEDRAQQAYVQAWSVATEDIRQTMGTQVDIIHSELRDLHPNDQAKAPWFDFRFDVMPDGRPTRVRLIDNQSSAEQVSYVRDRLLDTRFRPLIIDGQPVRAPKQQRRLTYRAIPIPESPSSRAP